MEETEGVVEQTVETPVVDTDDRRAVLEAAFEEHDGGEDKSIVKEPKSDVTDVEPKPVKATRGAVPAAPSPDGDDKGVSVEKAPQSWRVAQRAKWDKIDPDIRQEIVRREQETTKVLGESAQARTLHNNFHAAVAPYQARINSVGLDPVHAAAELFKADYILSSAPKTQRAQYMAQLINSYGIDIMELDSALAGVAPPDPVQSQVEQMLAQRLAPFQQYIQSQQAQVQQREQETTKQINQTVEQMAQNPKYEHFQDVRQDMADLVEMNAKRGVYLTLDDAYTRAIAMNPEVSQQVATKRESEARKSAAQTANSRAQQALRASVSVGGAPGGVPVGASGATDRRSMISAAFDTIGR